MNLSPKIHFGSCMIPDQYNFSFRIRERFSIFLKFFAGDHVCVNHVVMIWAKRNKIFNAIRSAIFFSSYMMNSGYMMKSTKNTLAAVSDSCGLLSPSIFNPLHHCELFSKSLLPAFLRAITNLLTAQIGQSHLHGLAAIFARHFGAIIHRVFTACKVFSIRIATPNRTKLSTLNVRHCFKNPLAVLTFMLCAFFSFASTIMTRYKPFPLIRFAAATTFTKFIFHI